MTCNVLYIMHIPIYFEYNGIKLRFYPKNNIQNEITRFRRETLNVFSREDYNKTGLSLIIIICVSSFLDLREIEHI